MDFFCLSTSSRSSLHALPHLLICMIPILSSLFILGSLCMKSKSSISILVIRPPGFDFPSLLALVVNNTQMNPPGVILFSGSSQSLNGNFALRAMQGTHAGPSVMLLDQDIYRCQCWGKHSMVTTPWSPEPISETVTLPASAHW